MTVVYWLAIGVISWLLLCFYRIWQDSWPWNEQWLSYVRGFALCVVLGPLCIPLALISDYYANKRKQEEN